jgi:tetratricopeptide (TPR) repeat protein
MYAKEATTLCDIKLKKQYNCVAATILYNLICDDVNLTTGAFETPTHVYTIFNDLDKNIIVENTSSMGFNMLKNLKLYSKYLSSFYPESQILKIGLDRLYAHENSKGREINNTELLGLLAYNQAYFAMKEKDFKNAYQLVLLAQLFNSDSRSNIEFEIGLYYQWGNQLYKSGKFDKAFGVFADGFYRYPDNGDFRQNTRASFFKIMYAYWQKKEWRKCQIIIDEMLELNLLTDKDMMSFRSILKNWILYFIQKKDKEKANKCLKYYNDLFEPDNIGTSYKEMIDKL